MRKIIDLKGQVFDRWTVIDFSHTNKKGECHWICECSCADKTKKSINGISLRRGDSRSCGCYAKEMSKKTNSTHSFCGYPLFFLWVAFNKRCNNPLNVNYQYYGGRGIKVIEEWNINNSNGFPNFNIWAEKQAEKQNIPLEDLYYKKHKRAKFYTLDRIDNNKGYGPDNCRWATHKEQNANQRKKITNAQHDIILNENKKLKEYSLYLQSVLKQNNIPFNE